MDDTKSTVASARQQTAAILYSVIDGQCSANNTIDDIRRLTSEPTINDDSIARASHALVHYSTDDDIRQNDQSYADLQIKAMRAMADQLAQGLPLTKEQGYW